MYPRNAASPEPIAIGAVIQISDGAVQSSGVTVRVKPVGVSEADGGGTTAYSTDGVVLYTPTQAETNYTSFVLIAKKTGCIPASVTVVTSASSTAGHAGTDQSKIANPTSTVNLSGTTISTSQQVASVTGAVGSVTGNVGGNVVGSVGSISGVTFPSNFASMSIDGSGRVLLQPTQTGVTIPTVTSVGSVSGNVGGISGVTFPANFGALGIDGTGAILSVASVDELGASALSANSLEDQIALAVWSLDSGAVYVDGSFGDRILISANNTRALAITGSGHIAAVLHDAEPNSIPEDAFVSGAISARVIAADAIDADAMAASANTEIANAVAATQALSRLDSMIESDGAGQFRFDTIAVSLAAGGGGGGAVNITVEDRSITVV